MRAVAGALGPVGDLMMPWVSVDDVAAAAVAHVLDHHGVGSGGGDDDDSDKYAKDDGGGKEAEKRAVVLDWQVRHRMDRLAGEV